jgi:hypothetical protein
MINTPATSGNEGSLAIERYALASERNSERKVESQITLGKGTLAMNNIKLLGVFACVGVLAVIALPQAEADASDQETVFTFNGPVEIPGIALSPGTYVFKLADSSSDRNIVQVFNKDQTHLYATLLAIPDRRLKPTGKTIITFEERAAGAPEAVRAWFYPDDDYGHEFVYPKVKAAALAKANKQRVVSMPDELTANITKPAKTPQEPHVVAMKQAHLTAQQPTGEEVDYDDSAFSK